MKRETELALIASKKSRSRANRHRNYMLLMIGCSPLAFICVEAQYKCF